ncbi:MAG: DUF2304 domain-containing protein [Planctomycetota bacterium]
MELNLFQQVVVPIMGFLTVATIVAGVRSWLNKREAVLLTLLWLAIGVSILLPDLTQRVARMLGIDRGTNLVVYLTFLIVVVGFFFVYRGMTNMKREITLLVRHVAIRDANQGPTSSTPTSNPANSDSEQASSSAAGSDDSATGA